MTTTELLGELARPLLDPGQRAFAPFLLGAVLVAAAVHRRTGGRLRDLPGYLLPARLWRHRSTRLDGQLMLVHGLGRAAGLLPGLVSAAAVAMAVAGGLDRLLGVPQPGTAGVAVLTSFTVALFVVSDFSRWALHALLHRVPALWELHQVHHSAQVLTPLTYYRTHPLESALYAARGALATGAVAGVFFHLFRGAAQPGTVLGVGALGFGFNLLGGNLRHSHVWLSYGRFERWLVSPAQHQLHHARGVDANYGAWLAIWDRWAGTWRPAEQPPEALGLEDANHAPDELVSALVGPVRGLLGRARPGLAAVLAGALVLAPAPAGAEDAEDGGEEEAPEDDGRQEPGDGEEEPGDGEEGSAGSEEEPGDSEEDDVLGAVSVLGVRQGVPRVAGSAHVVDAATLEKYEYNDIHRVLASVPGVYVREEDGFGLRPNIGLRGANSDRSSKITLMEDGVLLAPAPYSAPAAYYFPVTTRMVGVEVFKGPAATRHGPNTVGGALNLQTRRVPVDPTLALDAAFGLQRTRKLHGYAGGQHRWFGVLIEGAHLASDGFKKLDGGGPTGFDKSEVMLKLQARAPRIGTARSAWELKVGYANERSHETYMGLSDADFAADPQRRYPSTSEGLMRWNRTQVELAWELRLGADVTVRTVAYHHWMDRSWRRLASFVDGPEIADVLARPDAGATAVYFPVLTGAADSVQPGEDLLIATNQRRFHAAGVQSLATWRKRDGLVDHELEVGVRVHGDRIDRLHAAERHAMVSGQLVSRDESSTTTDNTGQALAIAVHAHEDLGIGRFRVLPGVRVEVIRTEFVDALGGARTSAWRAAPLWGLGLHAQPLPWLSVLGGSHLGFSPVAPGQAKDTEPEYSVNSEAGARVHHRDTKVEAIGFFNDYLNMTGTCTFSGGCADGQVGVQSNAGRVHVYGAEFSASQSIRLPRQIALQGSLTYTWTGSSFRSDFVSPSPQFGRVRVGDRLPYVPEHRGSLALGIDSPWFGFEATAHAQTALRDLPGQGPIPDGLKIPGHVVVDLAAEGRILPGVRVYGTVNNLTNATYMVSRRPFGARGGQPFTFLVGVKLQGWPGPVGAPGR